MDNLRFGTTARRRARRRLRARRAVLILWGLSTLGVGVGAPLTFWGLDDARGTTEASSAATGDLGPIYLGREKAHLIPGVGETPQGLGKNDPRNPPGDDASIEGVIRAAAAKHGLDGDYLISVAACESGLDPRAYNSAGYHGLFQYDEQTWAAYGEGSIWDPQAQAEATAMLIADGQSSRWPNCA